MVCRRCSNPLPPYAERCGRCGASAAPRSAGSAASIASDPPPPSTTIEFDDEETVAAPAAPLGARAAAIAPRSRAPAISAQLFAWSVDLFIVAGCAGLHLIVARVLLGAQRGASADYWLDLLLRGPRLPLLWAAVAATLAVAYSWIFAVLGGRTPGLALAGLRLQSVRGGSLRIDEALIRAALAIPSAALGLAGFALALLDPRGQTLHDKLCGTIVVREIG
ncbi:MAG TPA: RDD family protein [Myxococcales bacterium]|nr:RDD family protein [Myxococcales bacterium]